MKHILKKYRGSALLLVLFIFSLHINAVFEGRNEKLQEYTSVRNNVEIESYNASQKATGSSLENKEQGEGDDTEGGAPISDSPLFFLLLGGLSCGGYIFHKGRKTCKG